ncbi:hypothetical protein F5X99DRAFT_76558 [Biscogniauxia marginata]|nr:hypothetical protein F5X99DRAFT_76558 [Biscogniauxia marginata]
MAAIAASIAATAAGLTYLDGKYHLRQDWQLIRAKKKGYKLLQKALEEKRVSPYYFFERHAQAHPGKECVWTRERSYTRAEAYWRVNQYAQFFLAGGVRPGDLVALFMANSADFVFAWMGLFAVGAAPALMNHNLTRQALLHCLGIAGARLILADGPPALLERLDAVADELAARGVRVVRLDEDTRAAVNGTPGDRPPDELREGVRPDSAFGLFYTSGTTGMPKACVLPAVAGFLYGCSRECGFAYVKGDGDQRYYDCMPLYHGTGGISGMTQLLTGHTLCLAPKFSVSAFWDDIRASRATWFVYVGETLRYLLAAPPSPLDRQHAVRGIYGNGLRPDVWVPFRERFGIDTIHEFFNSTEGILPLDNPARGDFRTHSVGHHGLLERLRHRGALVPVEVDPDTGDIARDPQTGFARRVPHRVGGEILVRQPPTVTPPFPGYYNNPDATEGKYVRDVFEKGDWYYRTGDALRRDDDGRWFFLDRLGDTFRWKGENVSTAEVSEVLGRYPGVGEATVYGVSLPGHDGKAGMAAIYVDQGAAEGKFDYAGLLKHARTHLPKYAVPIFIREIKERSSTHNNKQDKVPLKRAGVDPAQTGTDAVFWIGDLGKGDAYVPFTESDWEGLKGGKAKL